MAMNNNGSNNSNKKKECFGFEFNVSKGDESSEVIRTLKNMCEAKGEQCQLSCCESDQSIEDEDSCDGEDEQSLYPAKANPDPRSSKEIAKARKEKEKEQAKKRKQMVKECKKKAKEIIAEYKKKEKERQNREKERRKKIKEYEKKKLKQEKKCRKDRDKCEKEKEKERKQREKAKLKKLKDKMKMKCESLKYAHGDDDDCPDEDWDECCSAATAKANYNSKNPANRPNSKRSSNTNAAC